MSTPRTTYLVAFAPPDSPFMATGLVSLTRLEADRLARFFGSSTTYSAVVPLSAYAPQDLADFLAQHEIDRPEFDRA